MKSIKFEKVESLFLLFTIILGAFVFLYKLGSNPPGLFLDEAGTGYNAYSIFETGRDEYGKLFPIAMRFFGSYTPPLQVYFLIPIFAIFGLTTFSVRLLSTLCAIISIPIVYLIIKKLNITNSKVTPILGTLLFTTTPWTVFYARMGYEQYLAFLFFCITAITAIKSLQNPRLLIFLIPWVSLSTYTDFAQRIVGPLFLIGFIFIFRNIFINKKYIKPLITGLIIGFLIFLPNLYLMTTPSFYVKSDRFYWDVVIDQGNKIKHFLPAFLAFPLAFIREFLSKFTTYFSPYSLFYSGDSDPQRSISGLSVFYPWMVIPYIVGIYYLWRLRRTNSTKLLFLLLIVAPIPGAITKDPFHIQRTLPLLLPVTLLITIGLDKLISMTSKKIWVPTFLFLFLLSLLMLWRSYFVLLPFERADVWESNYKNLTDYIVAHPEFHFAIDQPSGGKPEDIFYIQYAFYSKLSPKMIQKSNIDFEVSDYYKNLNFNPNRKLNNVEIKPIDWGEANRKDYVFVGNPISISDAEVVKHNLILIKEFKNPVGKVVIRMFKSSPDSK